MRTATGDRAFFTRHASIWSVYSLSAISLSLVAMTSIHKRMGLWPCRLTERAEKAEGGMLEASRRADVAERQLQRRDSEAGHLIQKQAYTEQTLQDLHEQHAQAAAAAAARQLVMHVGTPAHAWALSTFVRASQFLV